MLIRTGTIDGRDAAEDIHNMLMCAEMLGASLCMVVAFPWSEYKVAAGRTSPSRSTAGFGPSGMPRTLMNFQQAFWHAISVSDVAEVGCRPFRN